MDCLERKKSGIYKVKGIESNSASPTDTWSCDYYNSSNAIICKSFFKVWLGGLKNFEQKKLLEIALNYEANVYKQIKEELIDTDISHSFVEILDYKELVPFNTIINFLYDGMPEAVKIEYENYILRKLKSDVKFSLGRDINIAEGIIVSEEEIKNVLRMNSDERYARSQPAPGLRYQSA
jgi:hypothetical protein